MQHVIITGASRGLGKALAEAFDNTETTLHLISRSLTKETVFPDGSLSTVFTYSADFADTDPEKIMSSVFSSINKPEFIGFINNAATIEPLGPLGKVSASDLTQAITVNFTVPLLFVNAFIRLSERMSCDKRIINITSGAAKRPYYGWSGYCPAKAALNMLTQIASVEQQELHGDNGVKVMAIAPGILDTDIQKNIRKQSKENFSEVGKFIEYYKASALLPPTEVAAKIKDTMFSIFFPDGDVLDIKDL